MDIKLINYLFFKSITFLFVQYNAIYDKTQQTKGLLERSKTNNIQNTMQINTL